MLCYLKTDQYNLCALPLSCKLRQHVRTWFDCTVHNVVAHCWFFAGLTIWANQVAGAHQDWQQGNSQFVSKGPAKWGHILWQQYCWHDHVSCYVIVTCRCMIGPIIHRHITRLLRDLLTLQLELLLVQLDAFLSAPLQELFQLPVVVCLSLCFSFSGSIDDHIIVADTNVSENLQKYFLCPRGMQQCCNVLSWTCNIAGHNVATTMCPCFAWV